MSWKVGILITPTAANAVLIETRWGRRRATKSTEIQLPDGFLQGPTGMNPFPKLAKALGSNARRADTEVSVAVPDPLIVELPLDFAELPDAASERNDLIRLGAGRAIGREPSEIECAYTPPIKTEDGLRVLTRIMPAELCARILRDAAKSGLRVTRLEAASRFLSPSAKSAGKPAGVTGNLIHTQVWWSLSLKLNSAQPARTWSGWRGEETEADIAAQAIRVIRTHTYENGPGQLTLQVRGPETLSAELIARSGMNEASEPIDIEHQDEDDPMKLAQTVALS